jgi:rhamnose utilization protein RhaD (predicted bifunctional aldolase and dehydrogenase)
MRSAKSKQLKSLIAISAAMGRDPALIQASGGNTSLKEDRFLWVKASGKNLARAEHEDIFVQLSIDEIRREASLSYGNELNIHAPYDGGLRPSIETSLHALIPHRVVLHSHALDVISVSILPHAREKIKKALGAIKYHYVPYKKPGKLLTQEIANALAKQPADVFILANHGLVVGASNPDEALALQAEVIRRLFQPSREYSDFNKIELTRRIGNIEGAYLPKAGVIHSLAIDPWSLELAQRNPAYPDHVVFCGVRPWVMSINNNPPSINASYGLIPGVGVFLLPSATAATEAMLQAQAEVFLRIPPNQEINLLSDDECDELLNWDAEKYRQALGKSE